MTHQTNPQIIHLDQVRAARSIDMELMSLERGGLFEHLEGRHWQLTGDVSVMRACFDELASLRLVECVTMTAPLTWIFNLTKEINHGS